MPTLTEIRSAIVAKIQTVPDVGIVHDYERYLKDLAKLRELFETPGPGGGILRGWLVRRVGTREVSTSIGRNHVINRWQIRGYMALSDKEASEKAFDLIIEQIRDAFRADENLGGVIDSIVMTDGVAGIQVDDSGPVMFGSVLCHGARLSLNTSHYL